MAEFKTVKRRLKIALDGGEIGGRRKTYYNNYSDVKADADVTRISSTANALAGLMKYPVKFKQVETTDEIIGI